MNTPSTILDPVTGLPLDQYSGVVQQIPLGSQVFPFRDLNADGRMTRAPIYGDDIIPTSALVAGQDHTGEARLGLMDTARKLYTREAVYQNLGQPIPDGTTAPVDVNVVSGGGGGGAVLTKFSTYTTNWSTLTAPFLVADWADISAYFDTPYLLGYEASVAVDFAQTQPVIGYIDFGFEIHGLPVGNTAWFLHGHLSYGTTPAGIGTATWHGVCMLPTPLDMQTMIGGATFHGGFVAQGNINPVYSANIIMGGP